MKRERLLAAVLVLLCPVLTEAQRGRRGGSGGSTISAPPIKGLVVTVHGALKQLTKTAILILADNNQIMTFRRSSQTKFFNNDKEIKPSDIDLEALVTIDASEDNDLKFLAIALKVDSPQKKPPAVR